MCIPKDANTNMSCGLQHIFCKGIWWGYPFHRQEAQWPSILGFATLLTIPQKEKSSSYSSCYYYWDVA